MWKEVAFLETLSPREGTVDGGWGLGSGVRDGNLSLESRVLVNKARCCKSLIHIHTHVL